MEILTFKVEGKFAHFRKYFANNTAFSFSIPPRTTLMGMVAGIMGLPKGSYHEAFGRKNLRFGVRVLTPLKKNFHRLNLLSIKSTGDLRKKYSSDFRGEGGRVQTPFEVVTSQNVRTDMVAYQIFITPANQGNQEFEKVKKSFLNQKQVYNTSLGTANFSARIFDCFLADDSMITPLEAKDFVNIHTAVPSALVTDLEIDPGNGLGFNMIEEELMPGEFCTNGSRKVKEMDRLLFSSSQYPLKLKVKGLFWRLDLPQEQINVIFMDFQEMYP
ncbi:MAG: CRISPR-associated protein Cas5 [Bacteroidia bacterium]|nr:CRISPR-associated protein Cas5 [Bacteroidia bacterium]